MFTLNYIKYLNIEKGTREGKSLVGKSFIFDDKLLPSENLAVISKVKRSEKVFKQIDLNKESIEVLCQIYKIEDKSLIDYLKRYTMNKAPQLLRSYLQNYLIDNDFERLKGILKSRIYEDNIYYKDKILTTIKFVSTRKVEYLILFQKMYNSYVINGGSFDNFVYMIFNILDRDLPDYVKEELRMYNSKELHRSRAIILVDILSVTSFGELVKIILKEEFNDEK
jgi:hypothetical protein